MIIQKLCLPSFHFIKINKRGGWEIFQKINKGGGQLFGTREYGKKFLPWGQDLVW